MSDALAHRGPDRAGTWIEGAVGLSHRLLVATPEAEREQQPFLSADGQLCLTADARVDNRDELRAALTAIGRPLRTDTDAELILQAYEAWGEDCPSRIIGAFAFAIWDQRRRQLYLARDALGLKPLYYHIQGGTIRWASEPTALFADGTVQRQPNTRLMCRFLMQDFHEPEETLDAGVNRLSAAHYMVVSDHGERKVRYWDVDPARAIRYRTEAEYDEHFLNLFAEVIRAHMRGCGPVGALLSGGLDSSAIVCTAQWLVREGQVPDCLETFSLLFDDPNCDERSFIDEVVAETGVRSTLLSWPPLGDLEDREQRSTDIFHLPTMVAMAGPLRLARERGIRVMIDGVGGDDLLAASLEHLTDLFRQGRLVKWFQQLRADADGCEVSIRSLVMDSCVRPAVPRPLKDLLRRLWGRRDVPEWIGAGFVNEVRTEGRRRSTSPRSFATRSQQKMYDELVGGWNINMALPNTERFCASYGIEARHPFFDRRLVEFFLALPEEQRWDGPWPKTILRRALRGILPEAVRKRQTKAEFSCIVDQEFADQLGDRLPAYVRESVLAQMGILEPDRFCQFLRPGAQTEFAPYARVVWETFAWLEHWCRSLGLSEGNDARPIPTTR